MKQKFRLFHLPVFIVVLVGLALALVLHFSQPRDSLLDYALTLQDGQFICEDGSIWELNRGIYGDRVNIRLIGKAKNKRFQNFGPLIDADKLLPHEYAIAAEKMRLIFLSSDGSVWFAPNDVTADNVSQIIPYYTIPAPKFEPIDGSMDATVKSYRSTRSGYRAYMIKALGRNHTARAYLSVELKDGRYYIYSTTGEISAYGKHCSYLINFPTASTIYRNALRGNYLVELCLDDKIVDQIELNTY